MLETLLTKILLLSFLYQFHKIKAGKLDILDKYFNILAEYENYNQALQPFEAGSSVSDEKQ